MKISKITNWLVAGAACLLLGTSCDVDPTFYSQVVPDTYYTNADAVWSRFNRPFTHWRWWVAHNDARVRLMEVGTDAMCVPTRGNDWFDGAVYQNMHHHHFMDDMSPMKDGWDLTTMGVAQSWSALEDLENIDFVSVGLTEEDRVSMINQLNVLAASFYLDGLDMFGGMPLYTSTKEDVKARATDVETFHFIDSLLDVSMPNLPLKETLGAPETNVIHRAVAAVCISTLNRISINRCMRRPLRFVRILSMESMVSINWPTISPRSLVGVMRLARRLSGQYLPRMPKVRRMVV